MNIPFEPAKPGQTAIHPSDVKVGDIVTARWTNNFHQHVGPAKVVKVNRRTVVIELTGEVRSWRDGVEMTNGYTPGHRFPLPLAGATSGNCVIVRAQEGEWAEERKTRPSGAEELRDQEAVTDARLLERLKLLRKQYDTIRDKRQRAASAVPMGQPILVGHHSESKHRKLLVQLRKWDSKLVELGREIDKLEARRKRAGAA